MTEPPLAERRCVACAPGTPPLDAQVARALLEQLPDWRIETAEGHDQVVREFRFRDFLGAVAFVDRLAPVAEAEGHHPDLLVGWGRVRVMLWTHAASGLTENDFVLAAKIDRLAG